ncbi:hypothetical protein FB451DRAFT_1398676 [Mycena latifolia]|nr:hypothetical protein FB451DRAFT_1398676 [Mycena latifolia]
MDGVLSHDIVCNYIACRRWLAQANPIFNRLGVSSNHEDYVFVYQISYYLRLYDTGDSIPSGYLFLCPLADLQSNNPSYFRHPECAAYWSLDPSGVERLGMEEAEQLEFPRIDFTMNVHTYSWEESVYAGIRQFHQGKGFDPDSQNVALELGYPLVQISAEGDGPFAHFEEVEDCGGDPGHYEVSDETPSEAAHKESTSSLDHSHTSSLVVMRPRFFEVAPASRRISARHGLHNVFTTSMPLYVSFCASLSMCLPAEEPAQEPVPAVDEATCFDLMPAAPMHTIAEVSPGSASETVVGAEAAAVSPYPYNLQPTQDAPAEPVAKADVRKRAEVPQPRQWADEGGWDSRAVFMPVSEVVPAAATVATTKTPSQTRRPRRGWPPSEDESVFLTFVSRRCHELYCGFTVRLRLVTRGRTVPDLPQELVRRVRLGVRWKAQKSMRALGGVSIGSADSDSSYGRDSERSDGGTPACESRQ